MLNLTFEEAKQRRDEIEKEVKASGAALRAFPRNAVGLVSDSVRMSPEYIAAKARADAAFLTQRKFNAVFVKQFARELRDERLSRKGRG